MLICVQRLCQVQIRDLTVEVVCVLAVSGEDSNDVKPEARSCLDETWQTRHQWLGNLSMRNAWNIRICKLLEFLIASEVHLWFSFLDMVVKPSCNVVCYLDCWRLVELC